MSRQESSNDRRERLVATARELVRQGGMAALSLRTVAERENTSTQAIYTLFGGKDGLVRAIYSHWMDELEQRLRATPASVPEALLAQTALIYRECALSDPALFLAGSSDKEVFGMLRNSGAFKLFASFVLAGMEQGQFRRTPDPEATATALWGAVHGAVLFEICSGGGTVYIEETFPVLLRGLHPEPS